MLVLGSRSLVVDGIPVFADHADPRQFWYLPSTVGMGRRRDDGRAAFTFIKYRPAAVAGGAKGGGFLTFEVDLRLAPELERRILARVAPLARGGTPRLAPVAFDSGTVQCIALDQQGSGGTTAPAGAFNAVERILGATIPSLAGDCTAAFGLTLSQEGAVILEQAFAQGTTPIGVVYALKYMAMRPALNVKITAELERVYRHFSGAIEGQYYFVRAGIDAGFEKLVQNGAIKIEVRDFTGAEDKAQREKWALDFFKDHLLTKWFEPTLNPGQLAGGAAQAEALDAVMARAARLRPPAAAAPQRPQDGAEPPAQTLPPSPAAGTGQGAEAGGVRVPPSQPTATGTVSPAAGTGHPAAGSTAVGTAASSGINPALARPGGTPPAAAPGTGETAGMPAVVSFRLKAIGQDERKTLAFEYDRAEAVERTHAPQAFFGFLARDLDRRRHFVEVDLDDSFFRAFTVVVAAPIDFARIGLQEAQVAIDYGDPTMPATHKHADFRFTSEDHGDKRFEVAMSPDRATGYRYGVQYHFDPLAGWDGVRSDHEVAARLTEDRTLLLNPFAALRFLELAVVPGRMDWQIVERVEVELVCDGPDGFAANTRLTLTEAQPSGQWKLRLPFLSGQALRCRPTYHLQDRSTRLGEWAAIEGAAVIIDDPFADALELLFVPVLDARRTRNAFVELEYADSAHNYRRSARIRLEPDQPEVPFLLSVIDPRKRSFRYRVTIVGTDGRLERREPIETSETLLSVFDAGG